MDKNSSTDRRDFLKQAAYSAPAIMTLAAAPAFAQSGSGGGSGGGGGNPTDGQQCTTSNGRSGTLSGGICVEDA